jgi:hypothetical protein
VETLIETTIVDLLDEALTAYSDNWPAHIERYLNDYSEPEDYPVIVVNVSDEAEDSLEIQGYTIEYILNIYIVCVDEDYADVLEQRKVLKDRIKDTMRSNIFLDHIVDPDTNETVQYTRYRNTEYSVGGFADDWQTIAKLEYAVLTERLGPF